MHMKFFHYSQNNSGGVFDFSENQAIMAHVIIEATDASDADTRAIQIGLYFDGCDDGLDCTCCGDRWSRAYGEGYDKPTVYDYPASDYHGPQWMADGKEIVVHYADRRVEWHGVVKEVAV